MKDKIKFKDLSNWLRLAIIAGWFTVAYFVIFFMVGFIMGIVEVI